MSEQHAAFQERLRNSAPAVFAYVQHLSVQGCTVEFPPLRIAPNASVHEQFSDGGDIFVLVRKRIEIKGLSAVFTCREDWPFPEFFIDRKHRVEKHGHLIARYVYLNKALTHFAVVKPSTQPYWRVVSKRNSKTGNMEDFYATTLDDVEFYPLQRWGDQ